MRKLLFFLILIFFTFAAPAQDAVKTVSGGILNYNAVFLAKPNYPEDAKAAGADGRVDVQILLDEAGKIVSAKAISGHPLLFQAAEEAAWKSQFAPTLVDGRAVKVMGIILYNFVGYRVNWLAFGKAINATLVYDNLKLEPAAEHLTKEYETEKNELLALDTNPPKLAQRWETIERAIANIRGKLPPKEKWYFEVGLALTEVNLAFNTRKPDYEILKKALAELKNLLTKVPEGVQAEMVEGVKKYADYVINPELSADKLRQEVFMLGRDMPQNPK